MARIVNRGALEAVPGPSQSAPTLVPPGSGIYEALAARGDARSDAARIVSRLSRHVAECALASDAPRPTRTAFAPDTGRSAVVSHAARQHRSNDRIVVGCFRAESPYAGRRAADRQRERRQGSAISGRPSTFRRTNRNNPAPSTTAASRRRWPAARAARKTPSKSPSCGAARSIPARRRAPA